MAKASQTVKAEKPSIFWIMQYSSPFIDVYQKFKKKLGRSYQFIDPLENKNQTSILAKIIPQIITADFVIADVSTIGRDADDNKRPLYNGNVMFELGVAMSYRKKLVMISSATRKGLPFDISGYHVNYYVELEIDQFIRDIKSILDNPETVYSNPVSDHDKFFRLVELQSVGAPVPEAETPQGRRSSKTSLSSSQLKKLKETIATFPPDAFEILWAAYVTKQNICVDMYGSVTIGGQKFGKQFGNGNVAVSFLKAKKYICCGSNDFIFQETHYYLEPKAHQLCQEAKETGFVF